MLVGMPAAPVCCPRNRRQSREGKLGRTERAEACEMWWTVAERRENHRVCASASVRGRRKRCTHVGMPVPQRSDRKGTRVPDPPHTWAHRLAIHNCHAFELTCLIVIPQCGTSDTRCLLGQLFL